VSKRIAINTGGGDAPGLNGVIYAVTISASSRGWSVYGIRDGYDGLLRSENYPQGGIVELTPRTVQGIGRLGGTILGTTNRGDPLAYPVLDSSSNWIQVNRSKEVVEKLAAENFDAFIALGGDGSLMIAQALHELGLKVIGIPKTIDNDLDQTVVTFGFDSAVQFATECIDRLCSTAQAHGRIMVVEVMGRYAGWIAISAGLSGVADAVLIPEIPYDISKVSDAAERAKKRQGYAIVEVAEGCCTESGELSVKAQRLGQKEQLGGIGERICKALEERSGIESRSVSLGHLVRGGSPTALDRMLSFRFGAAAVRAVEQGISGVMITLEPQEVRYVPLSLVAGRTRKVPVEGDLVRTVRDLGICLGD